jgi:hypothetical protein
MLQNLLTFSFSRATIFQSAMKNRIIALAIGMVLLVFASLCAQAPDTLWTRTYGGAEYEEAYAIQEINDKGFVVAGYTKSYGAGECDMYLVKTDSMGILQWSKTYGGIYNDKAFCVTQTSDLGYILVGESSSFGSTMTSNDVYIVRTDSLGDTLWTRIFRGPHYDGGYSVLECADSGYIIAGNLKDDLCLIRLSKDGDSLWIKLIDGGWDDIGYSICSSLDGGFVVSGNLNGYSQGFAAKTDSQGGLLWAEILGDDNVGEKCHSIKQANSGSYIIVGCMETIRGWDAYIVNLRDDGAVNWEFTHGGQRDDCAFCVDCVSGGGFITTGITRSFGHGSYDIYAIRGAKNGSVLWENTYGFAGADYGYSIQETSDGGYIMAGWTNSMGAGERDILLMKTKPNPCIALSPPFLELELLQGNSLTQNLEIKNTENILLTWNIIESPEAEWISISQINGSTAPGESTFVTISFNSSDLNLGNHYDTLIIISNDSMNPTVYVPVRMTVYSGDSVIVFPNPGIPPIGSKLLTFGNLPEEGRIRVFSILGVLLWEFSFSECNKFVSWDCKDKNGELIPNGVYYFRVENGVTNTYQKGKFSVVR